MAVGLSLEGMGRWRGKVALITGASAGIGYLLAKQLTKLGMNVVGCARNITKIEVQARFAIHLYNDPYIASCRNCLVK